MALRPSISSAVKPVRRSHAGLKRRMIPSGSVTTIRASAVSTATDSTSRSKLPSRSEWGDDDTQETSSDLNGVLRRVRPQ